LANKTDKQTKRQKDKKTKRQKDKRKKLIDRQKAKQRTELLQPIVHCTNERNKKREIAKKVGNG
jgi:hypothetical protein